MHKERNCSVRGCGGAEAASLDEQALCLNHFLVHCYEQLEKLDPRGRRFGIEPVDLASVRAFVEECSRKALDVSLQSRQLTNLQRGRLLDILLWAGELFLILRAPKLAFDEVAAPSIAAGLRAASGVR
jgi:hypothetical protein